LTLSNSQMITWKAMTSMTPTVSGDGIHCHASCNFELSMQLGAHG